jgi:uncharacterized protein (UPF0332 family)
MNGRDFLPLARSLSNQGTEPARRSAVSRAYYAAFHVARDWLESLGFVVPSADTCHKYLCLRLQNCGDPAVLRAGAKLDALRSVRNRADYDMAFPIPAGTAARFVQSAQDIIRALDAAAADPARRLAITDTMKVYERDTLQEVTWRP